MILDKIKKLTKEEVLFWILCNLNDTDFVMKAKKIISTQDTSVNKISSIDKDIDDPQIKFAKFN